MNTLQVLIPAPQKIALSGGKADLDIVKNFYIDSRFSSLSEVVTGIFRDFNIKSTPAEDKTADGFKLLFEVMPPESFRLAVDEKSFTIQAGDAAGVHAVGLQKQVKTQCKDETAKGHHQNILQLPERKVFFHRLLL